MIKEDSQMPNLPMPAGRCIFVPQYSWSSGNDKGNSLVVFLVFLSNLAWTHVIQGTHTHANAQLNPEVQYVQPRCKYECKSDSNKHMMWKHTSVNNVSSGKLLIFPSFITPVCSDCSQTSHIYNDKYKSPWERRERVSIDPWGGSPVLFF